MNVLVCVMAAKCRHLFSVLTSGPVTVGAQRGTCGGPEIKTQRCMHRFVWMCIARLVIGTSRTVGSAKKFVRITSGVGGGEFTKTLRKVCTCQKLKFSLLLLEYCKIRECYAVANAFTIRNMYILFLYMKCNSRKINRPTKNMTKIVTLLHF